MIDLLTDARHTLRAGLNLPAHRVLWLRVDLESAGFPAPARTAALPTARRGLISAVRFQCQGDGKASRTIWGYDRVDIAGERVAHGGFTLAMSQLPVQSTRYFSSRQEPLTS